MVLSLDLETDGLIIEEAGVKAVFPHITCIGIAQDNGIQQFTSPWSLWNSNPAEAETSLLRRFTDSRLLDQADEVITYNGNSFDIPLLEERMKKNDLGALPSQFIHFDQMDFTLLSQKYRCTKEEAAARYADMYVPKTTRAVFCARAYLYKKVTPEIHMSMLSHNAMDVCTTWTYHHKMLGYPDYDAFISKVRANHPSSSAKPITDAQKEAVEAFL